MPALPVIVAQGGISPAGRTSSFHGYRRLVIDQLMKTEKISTVQALRRLRQLPDEISEKDILAGTLVRKLNNHQFNPQAIYGHSKIRAEVGSVFVVQESNLHLFASDGVRIDKLSGGKVRVTVHREQEFYLPQTRASLANATGQLPDGFEPNKLYNSKYHPRGLAMTLYGMSDALGSSGLDWEKIKSSLGPDQISVYAGSAMSQLDYYGFGGLLQARLLGKKVTAKQCPLGFAEMPADFISAYMLGSLGGMGTNVGACATLLYNLQQAVESIRNGCTRLAIVGGSEAPIIPEVIEGYVAMKAMARDDGLRDLDGLSGDDLPDWRRASRPFGKNCGFVLGESSQFFILMDDKLALEVGAGILGAVADVFINADGFKKSIASPGVGNYLTMARAAALGVAIGGEETLRKGSFVQAHGSSTPQNRVTESHILNETAKHFGIENWMVTAVKSYLGHSLGTAGGDQIMSTLGVWQYGWIPGIKTVVEVAKDVSCSSLDILLKDKEINLDVMQLGFINAKGFGGNNATALLLSPLKTQKMLKERWGNSALKKWLLRQELTQESQSVYEKKVMNGENPIIYRCDNEVFTFNNLNYTTMSLTVAGYGKPVALQVKNPYLISDK